MNHHQNHARRGINDGWPKPTHLLIRDPVHGSMSISAEERAIIDLPLVQRLRNVRQLGFAELAFPGATHTRYAHSLGAMTLAGRICTQALSRLDLNPHTVAHLCRYARLAALLHDVGHAPLSHSSEHLMPPLSQLDIPQALSSNKQRRARHEDYSVMLITHRSTREALMQSLDEEAPEALASLIYGKPLENQTCFIREGIDFYPFLRQIISGECDADRMDYLLRDSFFTGVNYGKYDHEWLISHMMCHLLDKKAYLALSHRAIFAFEDFLLSRYHMFMSVYYHHVPVLYDAMLKRFAEETEGNLCLASDANTYLECDDIYLINILRNSKNTWAKRIVSRKGLRLLVETTHRDKGVDHALITAQLHHQGIAFLETTSLSHIARYTPHDKMPIYVVNEALSKATLLSHYTTLYTNQADTAPVSRIYCSSDRFDDAQRIVHALIDKEKGVI